MSKTVGTDQPGAPARDHGAVIHAEGAFVFPVRGQRAIIAFQPRNTSFESLCAGVVLKLDSGEVSFRSALDGRKLYSAFREVGAALADIAQVLLSSAAEHWRANAELSNWVPPFPGASVPVVTRFSAMDIDSGMAHALNSHSTLHVLLGNLLVKERSASSLVRRVAGHWRGQSSEKLLARYVERTVDFGDEHGSMKIDFWGQHYGCFFSSLSDTAPNSAMLVERAIGRIVQLQTLKEMSQAPQQTIGLFGELRPQRHELVVVGGGRAPKSLWQVDRFADKLELQIRNAASPAEAAEMVADRELKSAA